MKQGTLYIRDRGREGKIKTALMAALLAALAVASVLMNSQTAILVVLGVWIVASLVVTRIAEKKGWYHRQTTWTLTDDTVVIDGKTIDRKAIKSTRCTMRPGLQRKIFQGWVLKVETQDNIYEWHSYYQDTDNEQSVKLLQNLADEMGADWQTWIEE